MKNNSLTNLEKETIILWNEAEDTIRVDTFNQKLINRLRKAAEKNPDAFSVSEPDKFGGVSATFPKKLFSYRFLLPVSAEESARRSEQAKAMNRMKNQGESQEICE